MAEQRFYWLKFKEDFFENDTIQWLEEQENGPTYVLFYLKLCLKSLKGNGILIRRVGDVLIPYDVKKIAEITRTPVDTAAVALKTLREVKLIDILENGALFLKELPTMVGSEAANANALRQKRFRENKKKKQLADSSVTNSNASSNEEALLEPLRNRNESIEYRDKSIEIDISPKPPLKTPNLEEDQSHVALDEIKLDYCIKYYENTFRPLSNREEAEILKDLILENEENDFKRAVDLARQNHARSWKYIQAILDNARKKRIDVVKSSEDVQHLLEGGYLDGF